VTGLILSSKFTSKSKLLKNKINRSHSNYDAANVFVKGSRPGLMNLRKA